MKKFLFSLLLGLTVSAQAGDFKALSFLNPSVFGPYLQTNAACSICYTTALYGGFTVSNAASAPLGGFTNINTWLSAANSALVGTNAYVLTWTNHNGIWVIPTNNTPAQNVSGILFTTNDASPLVQDVPLPVMQSGNLLPIVTTTNNFTGDATAFAVSPYSLSCRLYGAASAGSTLNFIFVGLPDGVNEVTGANGQAHTFQWGVTPAAGVVVVSTNFPVWKFLGCKAIRLRSATLTTSTAANIGVTVETLNFNGPVQ